jgi:hypothetical protein
VESKPLAQSLPTPSPRRAHVRNRSILLLQPPGWDICVSGPYSAGPYLQGYLKQAGFDCRWLDLNLLVGNAFASRISGGEAAGADSAGGAARDRLYFGRQVKLEEAARAFPGSWTLREGYQPDAIDLASPESVRLHLDAPFPYEAQLRKALAAALDEQRPCFVGVTITLPQQILSALHIARIVKSHAPDTRVILGGNIPSRLSAEMQLGWLFDEIDILAVHQGEETLAALLAAGPAPGRWRQVPNIIYRDNAEFVATEIKYLEKGAFAEPDFSDVEFDRYWGFPYAPVLAARGCYYGKCAFCAIPFVWGPGGFRGHGDLDAVYGTMRDTYDRYGISRFKLVEESMYAPMIAKIADRALADGLPLSWEGYARMDKPWFDSGFLDKASRAGLRKVYVGLELLEGESRRLLGKKDQPSAVEFLRRFHDAGILVHLFVLVGHPGTGVDEAMRTIEFALHHRHLIDTLEVNGFRYEKHTRIAGVDRISDPDRSWSLDTDYRSNLEPSLPPSFVDDIEMQLFRAISREVPSWTHPIHFMASPWTNERPVAAVPAIA